tara:strand:+ start:1232 stop:1411 length:180 start_codon:yes stop_codon:yes gene_type:complete
MNNNATDSGENDFNGILFRAIDTIDRFGNILSKIFRKDDILQNLHTIKGVTTSKKGLIN